MVRNAKATLLLLLLVNNDAFEIGNYRAHLSTTKYCTHGLRDAQGSSAACALSNAMETSGLILPGMEQESLTTLEDVIVTKTGYVSVTAMPNHPFEYLMVAQTLALEEDFVVFKNAAYLINSAAKAYHTPDASTLADGGWVQVAVGETELVFVKHSVGVEPGVDPKPGVNFTVLYTSGIVPDTWTLTTDLDETPLRVVASNSYNGGTVYQVTEFSNIEKLPDDFSVADASQEMRTTYQIRSPGFLAPESADFNAPPVGRVYSADFLPELSREYFEDRLEADGLLGMDWMAGSSLGNNGKGIPYFTIEEGSAADVYFRAKSRRQLVSILKFEFPTGCSKLKASKYCLFIDVDVGFDHLNVAVGIAFVDVTNQNKRSSLTIALVLSKENGDVALGLTLKAEGCAIVWQLGAGVSLQIEVCMNGMIEGKNLTVAGKRTILAKLSVSVKFALHVASFDLIGATITGTINGSASANNTITGFASIGVEADIYVAGAGMGLDISTNTIDNQPKKWHFGSGAYFNAYAGAWIFKTTWDRRYQIWEADASF